MFYVHYPLNQNTPLASENGSWAPSFDSLRKAIAHGKKVCREAHLCKWGNASSFVVLDEAGERVRRAGDEAQELYFAALYDTERRGFFEQDYTNTRSRAGRHLANTQGEA